MLDRSLRSLRSALDETGGLSEIIVVDDGSRDRTGVIADSLARELPNVRVVHQANQGIGGAFLAGAQTATGEYLMLWPADMAAEASDLKPYTDHLGSADVIVGCRRHRMGYNPLMLLNAWIYPKLVAVLFGLRLRDVNWIQAYRRSLFLKIEITQRGIPMLAEVLVRLRDMGSTILEIDVEMRPREGGVASASRLRVMWRTLVGLFSFWRTWRQEV